jgi:hypothetical protein
MFGTFVHRFQKRGQTLRKRDVAFAATQASSLFEISLTKTANGTFLRGCSLFDLFRCADAKEQIGKSEARGVLDTFFFRAGFAQIHLVHFAFQNLCQEDCRIIAFANVAQHLA